jgi:predicted nucleic acid-binding protein
VALTVVDASVVIAFLDSTDRHHGDAVAALDAHRRSELVLPASVYAEVLVGPYRLEPAAVAKAEQAITELGMRVEPLTAAMARRAAAVRARHPALRLPDALVLATGEILDAAAILTADRAWPRFSRRVRVI